jgi:hypothetical protein
LRPSPAPCWFRPSSSCGTSGRRRRSPPSSRRRAAAPTGSDRRRPRGWRGSAATSHRCRSATAPPPG